MEKDRTPRPGEIYHHFKGNLYQIITVATHTETGESMVVYQALYGDFRTYVRPLSMFMSKTEKEKYPDITQEYRFELKTFDKEPTENKVDFVPPVTKKIEVDENSSMELAKQIDEIIKKDTSDQGDDNMDENSVDNVNTLLLKFLDAKSYTKKLEIITSNMKHLTDRLINDMAVSIDCTVEEGPLEQRIQGLIYCLQTNRRFEDRRLR